MSLLLMGRLDECRLIEVPRIIDPRGSLSVVEGGRQVPFQIERFYYLYDVPSGAERGGHAHKRLKQFIFALSGSFDISIDDGFERKKITLNRPYIGLYLCSGIWREISNFVAGTTCAVLASEVYQEEDYIRNYDEFIHFSRPHNF